MRRALPLLALLAAVVAGAALRAEAAADPGAFRSADERAYLRLAAALARGGYRPPGMDDPVHWAPGAPALFAAATQAGVSPYAAQAVVGVLGVLAAALFAWLVAGRWAAVAAAAAVALHPALVAASGDALSEPLGALLVVLAVAAFGLAVRAASVPAVAGAGALLGAAVLVRADLLLVPGVLAALALVLLRRPAGTRRAAGLAAAYLGAAVLVVAPWSQFVSGLRGELTPVTTASWSTLWVATYLPGDGRMWGVKRALADVARRHNPRHADTPTARIRAEWIVDAVAARHPEVGRDAAMRREALANLRRYALGEPLAYGRMTLGKLTRMWGEPARGSVRRPRAWQTWLHRGLVGVALAGLAAGLVRRRRDPLLWGAAVLLVTSTLLNVVFVAEARHSLRLLPLLLAAGAAGIGSRRAAAPLRPPPA